MTDILGEIETALRKVNGGWNADAIAARMRAGETVPFDELEATSLQRFEILMHLEEVFGVEIDEDEFEEMGDLGALAARLEASVGTGA